MLKGLFQLAASPALSCSPLALTDSLDQVLVGQGLGKGWNSNWNGGIQLVHLIYPVSYSTFHIPHSFRSQTSGVLEGRHKDQVILRMMGVRVGLLMVLVELGG